MRLKLFLALGVLPLLFAAALAFRGSPASATPPQNEQNVSDADDDEGDRYLRQLLREHPTWRAVRLVAEVNYLDNFYGDLATGTVFALLPDIRLGDHMMGTYLYDSAAIDSYPGDPAWIGDYQFDKLPFGVSLRVGKHEFRTDPRDVNFLIEVVNDDPVGDGSYSDSFTLHSYSNICVPEIRIGRNAAALNDLFISWQLDDPTGTALFNDALLGGAPDLADWDEFSFGLFVAASVGDSGSITIGAHVISAENVIP